MNDAVQKVGDNTSNASLWAFILSVAFGLLIASGSGMPHSHYNHRFLILATILPHKLQSTGVSPLPKKALPYSE